MLIQKIKLIRHAASICIVSLLTAVFMPLSAQCEENGTAQSEKLQKLIREVEKYEATYHALKLNLTSTKNEQDTFFIPDAPKPIIAETQIALDVQGLNFRQEEQSKGRFIVIVQRALGGLKQDPANANYTQSGTKERITVSDGKTSRYFWKEDVVAEKKGQQRETSIQGGISDKPMHLPNLARPHMFLMENGGPQVPLSTYLKSIKAIHSFPGRYYLRKDATLNVQILGTEEFQGLECTRIILEIIDPKGTPRTRRELWLARDRNLIPVRSLGYTYRDSKEMPIAEAIVDEWQEVRPGVWFPRQAHYKRFDSFTVRRKGQQKLSWQVKYNINSVHLDPQFPPDVFTTLKFPSGTKVTVVKDGKIIKTIDAEANEL